MTEYKPDVIIADVFYDTPLLEGVSGFQDLNNGEYITLYNTTDKDINIGGWTIECDRWSQSLFIPFGMKISAKSTFVLVYSYKINGRNSHGYQMHRNSRFIINQN